MHSIKSSDATDGKGNYVNRNLLFILACLLIHAYLANSQEIYSIDLKEKWVDVGLLNPWVLVSMAIGFAFSLLSSMSIFFLMFARHKALSIILFSISFFLAAALCVEMLYLFYNSFVEEASGVGVGGPPFDFLFPLIPPISGLALSNYMFIQRKKKTRSPEIS